jgi:transposase
LARVDTITADITAIDERINEVIDPFAAAVSRRDDIPGTGPTAAALIIAEIGTDMSRFPTPAHLVSWARFAPSINESEGRKKGNATTAHGNRYLARILGEAAIGAANTLTFLGERYRRIAKRRGRKRALVAVGRPILVIIWHLLAEPDSHFHDLGPGFYNTRTGTDRARRNHVRQLEALGYTVTLKPAA